MNYFDHIRDYLLETMPAETRVDFDRELIINAELKEALESEKIVILLGEASFEEEVGQMIQEELSANSNSENNFSSDTSPVNKETSNKSRSGIYIGIILLSLLAALLFYLITMTKEKPALNYASLYEEPAGWTSKRGEDKMSTFIHLYLDGKMTAALDSLKISDELLANYWLSEIYAKEALAQVELSDSTLLYVRSVTAPNNDIRDRVLYLQFISLINQSRFDEAEKMKQELPNDMDEYYDRFFKSLVDK